MAKCVLARVVISQTKKSKVKSCSKRRHLNSFHLFSLDVLMIISSSSGFPKKKIFAIFLKDIQNE